MFSDEVKTALMQRNAEEIDEIKLQYASQISNLNREITNIKEKSEVKETELNKQVCFFFI